MTSMVLSIVFAIAVLIRAYAAKYGFYLNEFDPYYDYYAAQHIVTLAQSHGLYARTLHQPSQLRAGCIHRLPQRCRDTSTGTTSPRGSRYGRNVAATSQGGLQLAGAMIYLLVHNIFGVPITLYDLLVLLPVFFGAITAIVFYFLVRKIAGDAAGLFAAIIFAVSPPLIERGNLGWFKSEPLAILLFVARQLPDAHGLRQGTAASEPHLLRSLMAGIPVGLREHRLGRRRLLQRRIRADFRTDTVLNLDLVGSDPGVSSPSQLRTLSSAPSSRGRASAIVTNPVGLALIGGTVFIVVAQWAKTWAKPTEYRRTLVKLLFAFALAGLSMLSFGLVGGLTLRYLTVDRAMGAVAATPSSSLWPNRPYPRAQDYFTSYAILLSFGMAGA